MDSFWTAGQKYITISGASPAGYNGAVMATRTSATTFTYAIVSPGGTATTATFTYTKITEWWQEPVYAGTAKFRNCVFRERQFYHFHGGRNQFEGCTFSGVSGNGDLTFLPYEMQQAAKAFGRVLMGMTKAEMASTPFQGFRDQMGRSRDSDATYALLGGYGYNNDTGHNLWNHGQSSLGYSFDYDIPPMMRNYYVGPSGGSFTGVTWSFTPGGETANQHEVGDVFHVDGHAWYAVSAVNASSPYNVTTKAITWFKMASDVYSIFTDADLDWGKGSPDYDPSDTSLSIWYFPIGVLDTVLPYTLDATYPNGIFLKTTAAGATVTFVDCTDTPVSRPPQIVQRSKLLWTGVDTKKGGNVLAVPGRYVHQRARADCNYSHNVGQCTGVGHLGLRAGDQEAEMKYVYRLGKIVPKDEAQYTGVTRGPYVIRDEMPPASRSTASSTPARPSSGPRAASSGSIEVGNEKFPPRQRPSASRAAEEKRIQSIKKALAQWASR